MKLLMHCTYKKVFLVVIGLIFILLGEASLHTVAAKSAMAAAVTTGDPEIPLDELKILLKPLTKEELDVEAKAWMKLVQDKAQEISEAELYAKNKHRQLEKTEAAADALKHAQKKVESASSEDEQKEAQQALEDAQRHLQGINAIEARNKNGKALQNSLKDIEKQVKTQKVGKAGNAADPLPSSPDQQQLAMAREQTEQLAEQNAQIKEQTLLNVTALQEQLTALSDRFRSVIAALESKGGEVATYTSYVDVVNKLDVDVSDHQALWITVKGWLLSKEGGRRWIMNLVQFFIILGFFWGVAKLLSEIADKSMARFPNLSGLMRSFVIKIIKRGTLIVGLLIALTALEVNLGPLLALFGGVTFVLAFALQNNLSNFASGLMILVYKPFDIGDEVKLAGKWGWIDSITLANTILKGFAGEKITVPNSTVWSDVITNLTHKEHRKITIPVHINHGEDFAEVKRLLIEAVAANPKILPDPPPSAFIWEIKEYYIEFLTGGVTKTEGFWGVYEETVCLIQNKLREHGIGFALPRHEILVQSEQAHKI